MDFHRLFFFLPRMSCVPVPRPLSKDPLKIPTPLPSGKAQLDFCVCECVSVFLVGTFIWFFSVYPLVRSRGNRLSLCELFHLA